MVRCIRCTKLSGEALRKPPCGALERNVGEFVNGDNIARACVFMLNLTYEAYLPLAQSESRVLVLNIGCGNDLTVRELAEVIRDVVGFKGKLAFDASKPDGTPRKLLNVSPTKELGGRKPSLCVKGSQP
jgi:nucleoside-diphosphate-sugar epimerase